MSTFSIKPTGFILKLEPLASSFLFRVNSVPNPGGVAKPLGAWLERSGRSLRTVKLAVFYEVLMTFRIKDKNSPFVSDLLVGHHHENGFHRKRKIKPFRYSLYYDGMFFLFYVFYYSHENLRGA